MSVRLVRQSRLGAVARLAPQESPHVAKSDEFDFTLGCEFGGLSTPMRACENVGLRPRLAYSSELDSKLRRLTELTYAPEVSIADVRERDLDRVPRVDLYVATPECQPFSRLGPMTGMCDPRGCMVDEAINYVRRKLPAAVVLKEVGTFPTDYPEVADRIVNGMKEANYYVRARAMSTQDHGLPARRTRWIVVAFHKPSTPRRSVREFKFPKRLMHRIPVDDLLDPIGGEAEKSEAVNSITCKRSIVRATASAIAKGYEPARDRVFVHLDTTEKREVTWSVDIMPCMTKSIGAQGGFYLTWLGRRMTIDELMRFQGFRPDQVRWRDAGLPRGGLAAALAAVYARINNIARFACV